MESRAHALNLSPCRKAARWQLQQIVPDTQAARVCARAAQIPKIDGGLGLGPGPLALAGLKAALGLVDDVDPAFAPHDAVVAMAATQRFQ